jgi:hypothetical protein
VPFVDNLIKIKMDWILDQSLGGVLIEETVKDDQLGSCGCGRMFWLRAIGEFLKGGSCEVKKCF